MRAQQTPPVMSANALAGHVFHHAVEGYVPHVSLVYGFFPEARLRVVIGNLPPDVRTCFEVATLYLIRADSDNPKHWHTIAAFPFAG
jgi:hypothetical protein